MDEDYCSEETAKEMDFFAIKNECTFFSKDLVQQGKVPFSGYEDKKILKKHFRN